MTGGNGIYDKGGTGYGITRGEYTWTGGCITVTADNIDFTVRRQLDTRVFRNKAQASVLSGRKNNDVGVQHVAHTFPDNGNFTAFIIESELLEFPGLDPPDVTITVIDNIEEIQTTTELDIFFPGGLDFVAAGGYPVTQFPHGHGDAGSAQADRCPGYIHGHIATTNDQHALTANLPGRV